MNEVTRQIGMIHGGGHFSGTGFDPNMATIIASQQHSSRLDRLQLLFESAVTG